MVWAVAAGCFSFLIWAVCQSEIGIFQKFATGWAQAILIMMIVAGAVDADHCSNGLSLTLHSGVHTIILFLNESFVALNFTADRDSSGDVSSHANLGSLKVMVR